MKICINILRVVLCVVLLALLAVNGWFFAQEELLKTEPQLFGFYRLVMSGDDMQPSISGGDLVVYKKAAEYALGDVVVCSDGSVTRIMGSVDESFIIRADAQSESDERLISYDELIGKPAFVIIGAGEAVMLMQSAAGLIATLALLLLVLVLPAFARARGGRQGKRYRSRSKKRP